MESQEGPQEKLMLEQRPRGSLGGGRFKLREGEALWEVGLEHLSNCKEAEAGGQRARKGGGYWSGEDLWCSIIRMWLLPT